MIDSQDVLIRIRIHQSIGSFQPAPKTETIVTIPMDRKVTHDDYKAMIAWLDEHDPENLVSFHGLTFYFPDPKLAIQFKLTFG